MNKLPLIVSSARPFQGDEYDILQRRAILSWKAITDHRLMFNDPEDIEWLGDEFLTESAYQPTIKNMLNVALAREAGLVALVHSAYETDGINGLYSPSSFVMDMYRAEVIVDSIPPEMTLSSSGWWLWLDNELRKYP